MAFNQLVVFISLLYDGDGVERRCGRSRRFNVSTGPLVLKIIISSTKLTL